MPWVEVFAAFGVSHLVGDFLLQTEWQALTKHGGLTHPGAPRRALASHSATYLIAYVPALVWLGGDLGAGALWVAGLVVIPHALQDDSRLVPAYMRSVKRTEPDDHPALAVAVDQTFHALTLLLTALLVAS